MSRSLIGIDVGTTALKAAAFDVKSGRMLASSSIRLPVETGADGRREQSPAALLGAMRRALKAVGQTMGGLKGVCGVGVAAQGGSMIIADRASGRALTPMTLWNDSRALPEFRRLLEVRTPHFWRKFSMRDEPGMGLARLIRLQRTMDGLFRDSNIYAGAGEFLYFHLTEQWRQDCGNAAQIGCYDAWSNKLIAEPAAIAGAPLSFFAPLRPGHQTQPLSEVAARKLGLVAGIPVAGPYMDHEAGYMSCERDAVRPLQCSLGTAWVGNFVVPVSSTARSPFQIVVPSPIGSGRLIVQPLLTGNVTWEWALKCFVDRSERRALEKQRAVFDESLLPTDGLVAMPWLNRPNPIRPDVVGGACFVGCGPLTTPADLFRAVAAGMCYELARVFELVKVRSEIDCVILGGGASKGQHFRQLIAALFAPLPVFQIEGEEWMGARGCLRVFGKAVSLARTKRIAISNRTDIQSIRQGYEMYGLAWKTLYGNVPAGKAIRFDSHRRYSQ
ncbi:MAG: hypothetical protein AMXMBFR84_41760 [Candidatus Hydrogenedentota bacterium]